MAYISDALSENIFAKKKKEATADVTGQVRRFLVIQLTITQNRGGGEREREKKKKKERGGNKEWLQQ